VVSSQQQTHPLPTAADDKRRGQTLHTGCRNHGTTAFITTVKKTKTVQSFLFFNQNFKPKRLIEIIKKPK
jgi:hypothetical protein